MNKQKDLIHSVDWDTLIILDACTYEAFRTVNWIKGKLQKVISAGSTTLEWAINTFPDRYDDIIYLSGVPYIASYHMPKVHGDWKPHEHFYKVEDIWDTGYDNATMTVLPETVADWAQEIRKGAPGMRMIVHFIQPHTPMIGLLPFTIATWEELTGEKSEGFPSFEVIFRKGFGERLIEAYIDNLKRVLLAAFKAIHGRTIITADHGEGFGASYFNEKIYGHKAGYRVPELIEVPFFEVGLTK